MSNFIMPIVARVLDPAIAFLEGLSYLGVNSHIVKLGYVVS